jgi:hypothetical protein
MTIKTFALLMLGMILTQGCANSFLKGARMWEEGVPPRFEARYQASTCIPVAEPDKPIRFTATYYLLQTATGLGLLEMDEKGNGAIFNNKWADETNDYFFGYVRGSQGYLFTVPKDRAQAALRTFYYTVNFVIGAARVGWDTTTGPDGVIRPTGSHNATCQLAAQPASH